MISDLVQTAVAFGLFFAAHGLGVIRERNRKPKPPPPPPPPDLRCGCRHELSFHEGIKGCTQMERQLKSTNGYGEREYETVACPCKQYTGDLPDDWFARS